MLGVGVLTGCSQRDLDGSGADHGTASYLLRYESIMKKIKDIGLENIPTMIGDVQLLSAACLALSSSMTAVLACFLMLIHGPRRAC